MAMNRNQQPSRTYRAPLGKRRAGAATVELAVCLPLLALLMFGSIQACNLVYLKHALTTGAYEGTLELVKSGASSASVKTRVEQVLDSRGVKAYDVTIQAGGGGVERTSFGEPVSIRARADVNSNLLLKGWFSTAKQVEYTVTCPR